MLYRTYTCQCLHFQQIPHDDIIEATSAQGHVPGNLIAEALVAGARATAPPLVATTATAARRPPGRALHQRRRLGRSPRQRKNRWGGG